MHEEKRRSYRHFATVSGFWDRSQHSVGSLSWVRTISRALPMLACRPVRRWSATRECEGSPSPLDSRGAGAF
ncbi:hypothetical protein R1sor_027248 [Riccia sorocarpa]|uniref:Uncharacterized protein n=1 Tax=Riccia sorocarpa TaxID=122646 RepID=A0ABD3GGT4_9MARC